MLSIHCSSFNVVLKFSLNLAFYDFRYPLATRADWIQSVTSSWPNMPYRLYFICYRLLIYKLHRNCRDFNTFIYWLNIEVFVRPFGISLIYRVITRLFCTALLFTFMLNKHCWKINYAQFIYGLALMDRYSWVESKSGVIEIWLFFVVFLDILKTSSYSMILGPG